MNISDVFVKGRKVSIKKYISECIEIHPWIITNKENILTFKRVSSEKILNEISAGDEIEIEIATPAGIWGFNAKVIEIKSNEEILTEIPAKLSRMIKRSYKRVDTKIPLEFYVETEKYKGAAIDISEGGLYLIAAVDLVFKKDIKIVMELDGNVVQLLGEIKRKEKFMHGEKIKKYGYGIEFSDISREDNELIKDYVYHISKK